MHIFSGYICLQLVDHDGYTVYPKKYAHGFVVLCFVVVMQAFIMNSHEVFIHIHQGCFAGTGAIVRLPQCQWSKPDWYGKISQSITRTKHRKAKTVCIFLGIYCIFRYINDPCKVQLDFSENKLNLLLGSAMKIYSYDSCIRWCPKISFQMLVLKFTWYVNSLLYNILR